MPIRNKPKLVYNFATKLIGVNSSNCYLTKHQNILNDVELLNEFIKDNNIIIYKG